MSKLLDRIIQTVQTSLNSRLQAMVAEAKVAITYDSFDNQDSQDDNG